MRCFSLKTAVTLRPFRLNMIISISTFSYLDLSCMDGFFTCTGYE